MLKVYTDGAYHPSTQQGGYACIIVKDDMPIKVLNEGFLNTTNNRQELLAVLAALRYFKNPTKFTIYSDSQYVVTSISEKRLDSGIEENDDTKKNLDIGIQIYELLKFHEVNFIGVKGHNGDEFNELADLYAQVAAQVINPKIDLIENQDDKT